MSGKKETDRPDPGIPDDAVKVRETGGWAFYFSRVKGSVYIRHADTPELRLSADETRELFEGLKVLIAAVAEQGRKAPAEASRNKRKFPRYTRRCEVEFTLEGVTNRGIGSDFSLNGLFIRTNHPFSPGEVIDVLIHLSDGTTARVRGRVKRAMKSAVGNLLGASMKALKNGMGLELTEKDAHYLHFIRALLHNSKKGDQNPSGGG